jgi:hypothetical protein
MEVAYEFFGDVEKCDLGVLVQIVDVEYLESK